MGICNFFKTIKIVILLVLLSPLNVKSADENMVLPYDETMANTEHKENFAETATDSAPKEFIEQEIPTSENLFAETDLDPNTFRTAKNSHTNLVIALTQPEQRDINDQISGGDINSGAMREVEQNVLANMLQRIDDADDATKIVFIRLDVTKNPWIWDYFNDGASTQSVDRNNGTPQYLFFNQGNLISVLIGNRDDSAFGNWIHNNLLVEQAESPELSAIRETEHTNTAEESMAQNSEENIAEEQPTKPEEQDYNEADLRAEIP